MPTSPCVRHSWATSDEWGTTYAVDEVPQELREILDENGEYVIPSFLDRTVWRGDNECWVIDQQPVEGTIVACPQTVLVQLTYTCDGEDQYPAELPIELIDMQRPEISIILVESDQPHLTFGDVLRYPEEAEVTPVISIVDPCGIDQEELWLNGEPYQHGTPITGVGMHILNVRAVDFSGNTNSAAVMFEIRERPSYMANAEIESGVCVIDNDGNVEAIGMTVRISGEDFDHQDILLSSVRLLVLDDAGLPYTTQPISIKNAFAPDSNVLNHEEVAAEIREEHVRAWFEVDFSADPLPECPSSFIILGAGHDGERISFEFGSPFNDPESVEDDPLLHPGIELPDDGLFDERPPPEPPVECSSTKTFIHGPTNTCTNVVPWGLAPGAGFCYRGANSTVTAMPNFVSGDSESKAQNGGFAGFGCGANSSCSAESFMITVVQFSGNCCDCEVSFSANASVRASAEVSGSQVWWATAVGEIKIGFIAQCDSAIASATVNIAGPPSANSQPPADSASVNCSSTGCLESHTFVTTSYGMVETSASVAGGGSDGGEGLIEIDTLAINVEIEADADECDDDDCDPEEDEGCDDAHS